MSINLIGTDTVDPSGEPFLKSETISLLEDLTGIFITQKDRPRLCSFVQRRMLALGVTIEARYCDRLIHSYQAPSCQDSEWSRLMTEVTNGESYFFRDPGQLTLIADTLLPELIEQRRRAVVEGGRDRLFLNLWSAGCSTGEEPYSLAMILKETLVDIEDWQINLIATDINPMAIAQAKTGFYRDWSLRQIDPNYRQRYFEVTPQGWQVSSELRSMIQWDVLNLKNAEAIAHRIPWASMDLILCRNVFIYFEPDAIAQIVQQFQTVLNPEGYLVAGHAELEGQDLSCFAARHEAGSVVYQRPSVLTSHTRVPSQPISLERQTDVEPLVPGLKKDGQSTFDFPNAQLPLTHHTKNRVQWILAQEAFQNQRWGEAGEYVSHVLENNSKNIDALLMVINLAIIEKNWPQALASIRKIICIDPSHLIAHVRLMTLYDLIGNQIKLYKTLLTLETLVKLLSPDQRIDDDHYQTVGQLTSYITWKKLQAKPNN